MKGSLNFFLFFLTSLNGRHLLRIGQEAKKTECYKDRLLGFTEVDLWDKESFSSVELQYFPLYALITVWSRFYFM